MNHPPAQGPSLTDQETRDLEAHLTQVRSTLPAGDVASVTFDPATQLVLYRMTDGNEKSLPARSVLSAVRRDS